MAASKKLKAEHPRSADDDVLHATTVASPVARIGVMATALSPTSSPSLSQRTLMPDEQEGAGYFQRMMSFGSVDSSLFRRDSHDGL